MFTYQVLTMLGFCITASILGLAIGRLSARLLRFDEEEVSGVAQLSAFGAGALSVISLTLYMAEINDYWPHARDWSELLFACLLAQLSAFLVPGALAICALWRQIENAVANRVDSWLL